MEMKNDEQLQLFKTDGWVNTFKGLSGKSDVTANTYFGKFEVLDDNMLTNLWMGDGYAKKVISAPADDMTRNWMDIEGDTNEAIKKEQMRLNAKTHFNMALKWQRLYRGCIIALGVKDGTELNQPINFKKIKGIDWIEVYPVPRIMNSSADIVKDEKSDYFGDFETFKVQKIWGGELEIHRTKCLVFKGEPAPTTIQGVGFEYLYWGISVLQSVWTQLKNYGALDQGLINLMLEAVVGIFKLDNLAQLLAENNTQKIYDRIEIINMSKSIINAVLLGANEEFDRNVVNFAGIPDMIDRYMMNLSAVTEIPVTRLFGRSPAGQNATGESDLMNYYDMIKAKQEVQLFPPLQYFTEIVNAYTAKASPESILVKLNPIWQPNPMDELKMRKDQAEIDKIYWDIGTYDEDEIRTNRFEGGYSFQTDIEGEAPEKEVVENDQEKG
jgi:phage-related protein (TIGR01555 family)